MNKYIVTIEKVVESLEEKYPKEIKVFEQTVEVEDDSFVSKIAMLINGNMQV